MVEPTSLLKFSPSLVSATFKKRYKRFFADCEISVSERKVTAHLPNTGSMAGLNIAETPCLLEPSTNPKRKLAFTLEALKPGKSWVGVNTHRANQLMASLLDEGLVPFARQTQEYKREYSVLDSRIDFFIPETRMLIEVKSVTLSRTVGIAEFPDAVTQRGLKHIDDLMRAKSLGFEVALVFMVMRADCRVFKPAWNIDSKYSSALLTARNQGLKLWAPEIKISAKKIQYTGNNLELDFKIPKT